jgi:hypothetical protein
LNVEGNRNVKEDRWLDLKCRNMGKEIDWEGMRKRR